MEFIHGATEIGMKESGKHDSSTEMEQTYSLTEIFILVTTRMENQMATDNTFGRAVVVTLVTLKMG